MSDSYKLIVITGGSSGIGRSLAINFVKQNKQVLVIARSEDSLLELKDQFPDYMNFICGDISSEETRNTVQSFVKDNNFKIQFLINCAAIIDPIKNILEITPEEWEKTQNINVSSPLFLTTKLSKFFIPNGRVLLISSFWGHHPEKKLTAYCVSKAATIMLHKCLELEIPNLTFGILDPGNVKTEMLKKVADASVYNNAKEPEKIAEYAAWILESTNNEDFSSEEWCLSSGRNMSDDYNSIDIDSNDSEDFNETYH